MVAYTFGDGPWRDLLVRFGYDPRKHPDARLCVPSPPLAFLTLVSDGLG